MRKILCILLVAVTPLFVFAQTHSSVDMPNSVYDVLEIAAEKGYCDPLYNVKPYSESYVLLKLSEIEENLKDIIETSENPGIKRNVQIELDIILNEKKKFNHEAGLNLKKLEYRYESDFEENVPVSFDFYNTVDGFFSAGIYDGLLNNSVGFELVDKLNFTGDITKYFSYKIQGYLGLTSMPLQDMGNYAVGSWWYGYDGKNEPKYGDENYGKTRHVKVFKNNSVFPYSYKKFWDGNIFLLQNLSASGTEGWADGIGLGFGMNGEMRTSFFDNRIELSFGRNSREWGGMESGSSLILNEKARPFLAGELLVRPLKWLSFSSLTGVLEFPNQDYINEVTGDNFQDQDSFYYQNAYSVTMLDVDFDYFHFDFGSAVVWPKRFEIGYLFPLIDNVVYQDNIGDNDNLCLFTDIMLRKPGLGKIWISGYLDEMPKVNPLNMFDKTRYMFAIQAGGKVVIPWLPFASLSLRYSKVEPYCYTHHSINYTPWYSHYISEPYTNNGYSLGYYLDPNSDEINLRFEASPYSNLFAFFQYQLIRHGVDFGSRAIPGSNLYSELPPRGRDDLYKYFLKDGCYEWSHILSLGGSYDMRKFDLPLKFNFSAGYIFDYFTDTDSPVGVKGSYHKVNTNEYKDSSGVIISLGFTAFGN
ncbi:MAG: hypothetical protein MJ182_04115 [Treponema sp.]|nr:hypothetical protein [Treponema sp.]